MTWILSCAPTAARKLCINLRQIFVRRRQIFIRRRQIFNRRRQHVFNRAEFSLAAAANFSSAAEDFSMAFFSYVGPNYLQLPPPILESFDRQKRSFGRPWPLVQVL
jgi:hypothetical protein